MRTDGNWHAKLGQLVRFARAVVIDIILFGCDFPPCIISRKRRRRLMFGQQRMAEHVGV